MLKLFIDLSPAIIDNFLALSGFVHKHMDDKTNIDAFWSMVSAMPWYIRYFVYIIYGSISGTVLALAIIVIIAAGTVTIVLSVLSVSAVVFIIFMILWLLTMVVWFFSTLVESIIILIFSIYNISYKIYRTILSPRSAINSAHSAADYLRLFLIFEYQRCNLESFRFLAVVFGGFASYSVLPLFIT